MLQFRNYVPIIICTGANCLNNSGYFSKWVQQWTRKSCSETRFRGLSHSIPLTFIQPVYSVFQHFENVKNFSPLLPSVLNIFIMSKSVTFYQVEVVSSQNFLSCRKVWLFIKLTLSVLNIFYHVEKSNFLSSWSCQFSIFLSCRKV